jgi:hypothetical protein
MKAGRTIGYAEADMTRPQRSVLIVAAATLALMLLFPPWSTAYLIEGPVPAAMLGDPAPPSAIASPPQRAVSYRFILPWPSESSIADSTGTRTVATYSIAWEVLARNVSVLLVVATTTFLLLSGRVKG